VPPSIYKLPGCSQKQVIVRLTKGKKSSSCL
jgi:hypothetical protein